MKYIVIEYYIYIRNIKYANMEQDKPQPKRKKQNALMLSEETLNNPVFQERIKHITVSQYANQLIDKDLKFGNLTLHS